MGNYEKNLETDLQRELNMGRYGREITEYDSGYITDIYTEIADNNTSIYYYDIAGYLLDNMDAVSDWILENGYPGDLYTAAQRAEFDSIYMELSENSDDILLYWAYTYMRYNYIEELGKIEELDDHYIWEHLNLTVSRLENIKDQVDDLVLDLVERWDEEEQE